MGGPEQNLVVSIQKVSPRMYGLIFRFWATKMYVQGRTSSNYVVGEKVVMTI